MKDEGRRLVVQGNEIEVSHDFPKKNKIIICVVMTKVSFDK